MRWQVPPVTDIDEDWKFPNCVAPIMPALTISGWYMICLLGLSISCEEPRPKRWIIVFPDAGADYHWLASTTATHGDTGAIMFTCKKTLYDIREKRIYFTSSWLRLDLMVWFFIYEATLLWQLSTFYFLLSIEESLYCNATQILPFDSNPNNVTMSQLMFVK